MSKFTIICGENLTNKSSIYSRKSKKLLLNDKLNYEDVFKYKDIINKYIQFLFNIEFFPNYCTKQYKVLFIRKTNILKHIIKIIIFCIKNKDNTVFIQNPEILLAPNTQSKLADMFVTLSDKFNIKFIIETNSEHFIYKLCYLVNKNKINHTDIKFIYFKDVNYVTYIYLDIKGRFIDEKDELTDFPTGFFDATLKEYMSIF